MPKGKGRGERDLAWGVFVDDAISVEGQWKEERASAKRPAFSYTWVEKRGEGTLGAEEEHDGLVDSTGDTRAVGRHGNP